MRADLGSMAMPNRVLIVEDDAALLRGLKDNFSAKGYRVESAADGEAGLELALTGARKNG